MKGDFKLIKTQERKVSCLRKNSLDLRKNDLFRSNWSKIHVYIKTRIQKLQKNESKSYIMT